ncbi:unnamed protein product [Dibothriocephalus latus]|uniref:Uncharacterized protein n=1 Tax=Dibothriocephalus latus TaxID=60516 RepID=A0A3P7LNL1_DIBLA|nr:unnamed protein product [Dibothriocephalus latus]
MLSGKRKFIYRDGSENLPLKEDKSIIKLPDSQLVINGRNPIPIAVAILLQYRVKPKPAVNKPVPAKPVVPRANDDDEENKAMFSQKKQQKPASKKEPEETEPSRVRTVIQSILRRIEKIFGTED